MEYLLKKHGFQNQDRYIVEILDPKRRTLKVVEKRREETEPIKRIISFNDSDLDSGLFNKGAVKILKSLDLPLPSKIRYEKHNVIKGIQNQAETLLNIYHDILDKKAEFKIKKGISKAVPKNKNPHEETRRQIAYYDILGIYVNNISKLENVAKKTGQGIIHFNNPQQLIKRLELLAGSLIAGNDGVIQEFSQIAHLLHQMKVITKKQLNDLLKKYILNK